MSKFNQYAKRLNSTVKEAFDQYKNAEKAVKKTEQIYRDWCNEKIGSGDYEKLAKKSRAKANYEEAQSNLRVAGAYLRSVRAEVGLIRDELAAAIDNAYCVDPSKLDNNSIELLKSGIMGVNDYKNMLRSAQKADNITMIRIIGKYAEGMSVEADRHNDIENRAEYNYIVDQCRQEDGSGFLKSFDSLANAFERCTENTSMIDSWDGITSETIENF